VNDILSTFCAVQSNSLIYAKLPTTKNCSCLLPSAQLCTMRSFSVNTFEATPTSGRNELGRSQALDRIAVLTVHHHAGLR